jgi:hypothetical protein
MLVGPHLLQCISTRITQNHHLTGMAAMQQVPKRPHSYVGGYTKQGIQDNHATEQQQLLFTQRTRVSSACTCMAGHFASIQCAYAASHQTLECKQTIHMITPTGTIKHFCTTYVYIHAHTHKQAYKNIHINTYAYTKTYHGKHIIHWLACGHIHTHTQSAIIQSTHWRWCPRWRLPHTYT